MNEKTKSISPILLGCFYAILFSALLDINPWFSPPDWGKALILRVSAPLAILLFFKSLVFNQITTIKISKQAKLFFLFVLTVFISVLFSKDINFSLWGSPTRSGGFVNFLLLASMSFIGVLSFNLETWKNLLRFNILVGGLVSLIAVFQQYGTFPKLFGHSPTDISSTLGGPTFLGIYLLLCFFSSLVLLFLEKKLAYFVSLFLSAFAIVVTISQAAYLGLALGLAFFFFFYPSKEKKVILLKIIVLSVSLLAVVMLFIFKTDNLIVKNLTSWKIDDSRISAWKIALTSLKSRPLFGYGPENFSVAFDKYYDPSLPGINSDPYLHTSWWDRTHNFLLEITIDSGIIGLASYLAFFAFLIIGLRKRKDLLGHGLQTIFASYFISTFFGPSSLSSLFIFYLLIGFSLSLIETTEELRLPNFYKHRKEVISVTIIIFILFTWNYALKPFSINSKINIAHNLIVKGQCDKGLSLMDELIKQHSILNSYYRLKYVDFLEECSVDQPENELEYAKIGYALLKENIKTRPLFTRNWITLGKFTSVLASKSEETERKNLLKEADSYFEKAAELSPKRQDIFIGWAKVKLLENDYQGAYEKADICVNFDQTAYECYFLKAVSEIYLQKPETEDLALAKEKGQDMGSLYTVGQLIKAYGITGNYLKVKDYYLELLKIKPNEPQYHAELAVIYQKLGMKKEAKEEALKVLELSPEAKETVEEFIESLE